MRHFFHSLTTWTFFSLVAELTSLDSVTASFVYSCLFKKIPNGFQGPKEYCCNVFQAMGDRRVNSSKHTVVNMYETDN